MKKVILALGLIFSAASSFAVSSPDAMHADVTCHTAGIFDGGYTVVISSGGIAPHTEARLSESTFVGASVLGNYVVQTFRPTPQITVLADMSTHGDTFKLTLMGTPLVGQDVSAVLESNTRAGRFTSKMTCSRMLQNR